MTILKPGGRAVVVVPDNCLFADQAGAVFQILMEDCNKTNVVFFTKGEPTERTWVYDGRTNVARITKRDRPLTTDHFADVEACFGTDPTGRAPRSESVSAEDRWRSFPIDLVKERDYKIEGLKWLKDESLEDIDGYPPPDELAAEVLSSLRGAISDLEALAHELAQKRGAETKPAEAEAGD